MKKVYGFIALALVASFALAGAVTNTVTELTPFGDQFRAKVVAVLEAFETQINSNDTTADGAVQKSAVLQIDTNAATSVTTYTPGHPGQLLLGGVRAQYDTFWYADGTTTNDWNVFLAGGSKTATNVSCVSTLGTNILYFGAGGVLLSNVFTAAGQ
jgi:hypothetical protein